MIDSCLNELWPDVRQTDSSCLQAEGLLQLKSWICKPDFCKTRPTSTSLSMWVWFAQSSSLHCKASDWSVAVSLGLTFVVLQVVEGLDVFIYLSWAMSLQTFFLWWCWVLEAAGHMETTWDTRTLCTQGPTGTKRAWLMTQVWVGGSASLSWWLIICW